MKTSRLKENFSRILVSTWHNVKTIFRSHPGSSHSFTCSVFALRTGHSPALKPVRFCFSTKGTMAGGTCTGWQYTFKPPKIFRELHHVFINLPPGLLTKRGSVAIPGPPSPNTSVHMPGGTAVTDSTQSLEFQWDLLPVLPQKKMSNRWTNSKESGERHCPTHCLRFFDSPEWRVLACNRYPRQSTATCHSPQQRQSHTFRSVVRHLLCLALDKECMKERKQWKQSAGGDFTTGKVHQRQWKYLIEFYFCMFFGRHVILNISLHSQLDNPRPSAVIRGTWCLHSYQ